MERVFEGQTTTPRISSVIHIYIIKESRWRDPAFYANRIRFREIDIENLFFKRKENLKEKNISSVLLCMYVFCVYICVFVCLWPFYRAHRLT